MKHIGAVATVTSLHRTADWWHQQPVEIQAVLTLGELDDLQRHLVASLFLPNHDDVLDDIAAMMRAIERCGVGDTRVLDDWRFYSPTAWHAADADTAMTQLAETLQGDVLVQAGLLASLVQRQKAVA